MTETEVRQEIFRAVGCNCACKLDEAGDIVEVCAPHKAIAEHEEEFVTHMEFARSLRARWLRGEYVVKRSA